VSFVRISPLLFVLFQNNLWPFAFIFSHSSIENVTKKGKVGHNHLNLVQKSDALALVNNTIILY